MAGSSPLSPGSNRPLVARRTPPVVPDHTLLRLIGHGSYGEVWLAQNIMGTYRAVKVIYRSSFDNDRPYEREFAGIRKFEPISRSQESQVQILHIGRNDQERCFYYVMELADDAKPKSEDGRWKMEHGGQAPSETAILHPPSSILVPETYVPRTLQHEIETRGRLPFAECLRISLALAGALKHLHGNGLVHRDIKPSNIIFVNGIPKLADIGLVTESEATITYVGAKGFMAPEGPGRPRGDLYSLGKVIYEMCTGRDRMDFPALPGNFGEWPNRTEVLELLAVSLKACEPEAARRYVSAEALAADLVLLQAGKSVKRLRWLERNRRLALAVAGVAVLAAMAGWLVLLETHARAQTRQREVLVRDAQMLRMSGRQGGWSSNALQLLARAGQLRPDPDLRDQVAASLEGFDAHVARTFPDTPVKHLAFDPQGRQLLMDAGGRGHVQLWDSQSDQIRTFSATNTGPVWFASGGSPRQLAYAGQGVFVLLNPESGRNLQEFHLPEGASKEGIYLQALTVSADASFCAAGVRSLTNQNEPEVAVWETATGKLVAQATETCGTLAFSPDNACLAVGDDEGCVRLRALPYLTNVAAFRQDRSAIHCLAFARDPSQAADGSAKHPWLVAAGDAGGTIYIYQVALGRLKAICRGSHYDVYTVAFSPDGMTLASGGRDATRYWDVATGRSLLTIRAGDFHYALGFSPDGSKLAFGTRDGSGPAISGVIDLEPSRGVMALRGLSSQSAKLEFSHDGQRLAALSHNWEVGVWNLASNRLEHLLEAPRGLLADNAALAFSRDDSQLAFATLTDARLWDLKTGRLLRSWPLPKGLVEHLCFNPAGRLLLFQWDRPGDTNAPMCRVRDLFRADYETGVAEFPEFKGQVFDAVLSQNGDFVVVVGKQADGTNIVRVFDPSTGRQIHALPDTGNQSNDSLVTDPQTSRVGYWLARSNQMVFFNMPSGKLWRAFPDQPNALSPDGHWLSKPANGGRGVTIFSADYPAKSLTVGLDYVHTFWPQFSPNGRLFALGTSEGTVLVYDLEKTIGQLERLAVGWR